MHVFHPLRTINNGTGLMLGAVQVLCQRTEPGFAIQEFVVLRGNSNEPRRLHFSRTREEEAVPYKKLQLKRT
ncbi:hypothetical protein DPEC_G00046030 [Dallia pectoralis]|uniref:Uncharacterized protein n=1 Tax=Dallia pectoralis TaxID=75939 RepID=A0ACC2HAH3_DALPE|nr:hypothetical protein DPEC_G00046030 [Dallia pectoralis]